MLFRYRLSKYKPLVYIICTLIVSFALFLVLSPFILYPFLAKGNDGNKKISVSYKNDQNTIWIEGEKNDEGAINLTNNNLSVLNFDLDFSIQNISDSGPRFLKFIPVSIEDKNHNTAIQIVPGSLGMSLSFIQFIPKINETENANNFIMNVSLASSVYSNFNTAAYFDILNDRSLTTIDDVSCYYYTIEYLVYLSNTDNFLSTKLVINLRIDQIS